MPGGVHEHMRAWEPEEDQLIIRLLNELGPKWSKIVEQLPGRSVSSVRNRWQRIDKGNKLREAGKESKNRCQQCGKPKRGHVCLARLQQNRSASAALGGHFDNSATARVNHLMHIASAMDPAGAAALRAAAERSGALGEPGIQEGGAPNQEGGCSIS